MFPEGDPGERSTAGIANEAFKGMAGVCTKSVDHDRDCDGVQFQFSV